MSTATEAAPPTGLNPSISRNMLLLFVVGDVLGAGIYALVGEVGGRGGRSIWAAFLVALVLAVFTAFAYAELVTKYPRAGRCRPLREPGVRGKPFLTFLVTFAVMCSGRHLGGDARRGPSAATTCRAFVAAPDRARGDRRS